MGLETFSGKFISDLNAAWPLGTDTKDDGDGHLRGIKLVLQNTFTGLTGAVTATQAELNILDGVTSSTAELNLLTGRTLASTDDKIDNFPSGTRMLFQQTSAPSGWVKDTTNYNDFALRVVTGDASAVGGSGVSGLWINRSTSSVTLTAAQSGLPAHSHAIHGQAQTDNSSTVSIKGASDIITDTTGTAGPVNASEGHAHTLDMAVAYCDVIFAVKS